MSLVPSQAVIFSNQRGTGDYLCFTAAVVAGDAFRGAVAAPVPAGPGGGVGGSTRGWGTSVPSPGAGGRDALGTRLQSCR